MITGAISSDREAIISLRVRGPGGQEERIDAVIDTGFNDFLTLPPTLIRALALPRRAFIRATLGDGNIVSLPVYTATVIWHGQPRQVDVLETNTGPLIGMALLYGCRLTLDIVDGGRILIEALP